MGKNRRIIWRGSVCGSVYQTSALDAIKQGLITEADMDVALVNLFTVRMRLDEFDPKSKVPYAGIRPNIIHDPAHNDLAFWEVYYCYLQGKELNQKDTELLSDMSMDFLQLVQGDESTGFLYQERY